MAFDTRINGYVKEDRNDYRHPDFAGSQAYNDAWREYNEEKERSERERKESWENRW